MHVTSQHVTILMLQLLSQQMRPFAMDIVLIIEMYI